jgi:hypothetical protein
MSEQLEDFLNMQWGTLEDTGLVCTGAKGEGVILADTQSGQFLTEEEADKLAKHVCQLHNNWLAHNLAEQAFEHALAVQQANSAGQ